MPGQIAINRIGNALYSKGTTGEYVNVPHSASFDFELNQPFSFSVWVMIKSFTVFQTTGLTAHFIVKINRVTSNSIPVRLWCVRAARTTLVNNRYLFEFCLQSGGKIERLYIDLDLVTNLLYHVVFTKSANYSNANAYKGYVNGSLRSGIFFSGGYIGSDTIKNTDGISLGALINTNNGNDNTNYSNVYSFDSKIFNKELSAEEVKILYQSDGLIIPSTARPNLVANWNFDEKEGNIVKDSSGLGNHGTCLNMTTNLGSTNQRVNEKLQPITS